MTLLSAVDPVEDSPIDQYLASAASGTAVARFARAHDVELVPHQARYYRDLIPLARPEPGQQYAFAVDLDACTGCKSCVAACHSLNGLDDGESWRTVTLLSGGTHAEPFQRTVSAACHHCVDPACMNGCPVDAYEKDPVTGIVSHLDDQCIGCSYCTLTCPYEVPVFNKVRGIVRKCDMCKGRLAAGEAPACVQACPNGAIAISVVDTAETLARAAETGNVVVPGAPPSAITAPTTRYRTARVDMLATADAISQSNRPARGHPPLAVMLVLTQLAVGAFVTDLALRPGRSLDAIVAVAAAVLALGASVLHLGRPRYCYRAVIGLRHSWLSREVVAFGGFTGLAASYALVSLTGAPSGSARVALGVAAAAMGIAGVMCSVLVYTTTHRSSWRPFSVSAKFGLTAAMCGLAAVIWADPAPSLLVVLSALMVAKLVVEGRRQTALRFGIGLSCGVALPIALAVADPTGWLGVCLATLTLAGIVVGELLERLRFFTSARPPQ